MEENRREQDWARGLIILNRESGQLRMRQSNFAKTFVSETHTENLVAGRGRRGGGAFQVVGRASAKAPGTMWLVWYH